MIYSAEGDDTFLVAAQLIQAQVKKVGINITLKPLDATTMTQRRRAFDCDICFLSEAARADLDGQLFLAAKTGGPSNYNQISDPKADQLIIAQRQEGDPAKRTQILKDVLKHLNESGDAIPTWRTTLTILVHPYVKDFYINADGRNQGWLTNTWLNK
jgi:peptide/nickel transport system substrate-binding protein